MEQEKFNELLMSVLMKWDETSAKEILENNSGDLELTEENLQIFNAICNNIDDSISKMVELKEYKNAGGTTQEWLDDKISDALEKINATDEQKVKALEIISEATEKATQKTMSEIDNIEEVVSTNADTVNNPMIVEKETEVTQSSL